MIDEYDFIKKWPLDFKGQDQELYFIFKETSNEECQEFLNFVEKVKQKMNTKNNPKLTYLWLTKFCQLRSVRNGFHNDRIVVGLVNIEEKKQ